MIASLRYDFGKVDIFDYFVLAIINEGVNVVPHFNKKLVEIANRYYKGKFFGYITLRINSYSVDPRIYTETSKIDNLVAFAVVSENKMNISNIEVEKRFLNKPFEHFSKVSEAKKWVQDLIEGK